MSAPQFEIKVPRSRALLRAAHDFHSAHVGEFLLPRTLDEFDALAAAGELWAVLHGSEIVGACYVTREDDAAEAEFGGIILRPDHRAQGLASALGAVALGNHALHDVAPVISHVHRDNPDPLPLLTKRLGFHERQGDLAEIKKADLEAKLGHAVNMRADADGIIRGRTFDFDRHTLADFADRIEHGTLARVPVTIANYYFLPPQLPESLRLLRELATKP